jgi:hypothetical protein
MPALLARCLSLAGLGATLCLALPGAGFAADTSGAMAASPSCAGLGFVEKRIVSKAQVGVEALRDYIYISRGVHGLGMADVTRNLDRWLDAAHCSGIALDDATVRRNVALAARMPALR